MEVANHGKTAATVDFVTMYPSFDQALLKERLRDAITEAWDWEEQKTEEGELLKVTKEGWVRMTQEEAAQPTIGVWTRDEVLELVFFVLDNGYVQRGGVILKQVKGFGMGLACAPQIANLGCYPVERDYAHGRNPMELEHNYRFIDDILTLSGCIPPEELYAMRYKNTRTKEGELVYLGMELKWVNGRNGTKFITGMHFRDASYPIKIRRYPGAGSMVTDSQRMGVLTGQFIRAQRLCSTLQTFKEGVQNVVLAAMRRGYFRRELDRMWGKFLVDWWRAEELRRGELRAWFRKLTGMIKRRVTREINQLATTEKDREEQEPCGVGGGWSKDPCPGEQQHRADGDPHSSSTGRHSGATTHHKKLHGEKQPCPGPQKSSGHRPCRVGGGWSKDHCPYHPYRTGRSHSPSTGRHSGATTLEEEKHLHGGAQAPFGSQTNLSAHGLPVSTAGQDTGRATKRISHKEGSIWEASGDGSCLFYCAIGSNSREKVAALRRALAEFVMKYSHQVVPGLEVTTETLLHWHGLGVEEYVSSVVRWDHWGSEIELVVLPIIMGCRFKVFMDTGTHWNQYLEYGKTGPVKRLRFSPERQHYDLIVLHRKEELAGPHERVPPWASRTCVTNHWLHQARQTGERSRSQTRHAAVRARRNSQEMEEDVELLLSLAAESSTEEQLAALSQVLGAETPWDVLGLTVDALEPECLAAYKQLSIQIHPDKCKHQKSGEAFQKLAEAKEWALDKAAWHQKRLDALIRDELARCFTHWVAGGGALKGCEVEEEISREVLKCEQARDLAEWEEQWGRFVLGTQWLQAREAQMRMPRQTTRVRTQTHWYQSEVEEQRDRERRQSTRKRENPESAPAQGDDPEATSHNWKEGERLGEAKNPGPPAYAHPHANPPWSHTPGARRNHVQARDGRCGVRAVPCTNPKTNTMNNQPIGTPGNDGRSGVKDLHPGWHARSQPESCKRARGATSGVHVDHQRGVCRHAVNQAQTNTSGKPCWFGSRCKYLYCRFWHPTQVAECWFGWKCRNPHCPFGHPKRVVVGPTWGGRGRPQTASRDVWEPHLAHQEDSDQLGWSQVRGKGRGRGQGKGTAKRQRNRKR